MRQFPILKENEVVLVRADYNTGIVLDENFIYATNDNQKVYTIFNTLEDAKEYAKKLLLKNKEFEFVIYNRKKEVIIHIRDIQPR